MSRKRWPAIEPHWRVLYADGHLGMVSWSARNEARIWGAYASASLLGLVPIAIIKVTPK